MAKTYGQRFKELRKRFDFNPAMKITQERLRDALGLKRQSNVSLIETDEKVPEPRTILRHADALKCSPSELLAGVITEYDRIRMGDYDQPVAKRGREGVIVTIGADPKDVQVSRSPVDVPLEAARIERQDRQHRKKLSR